MGRQLTKRGRALRDLLRRREKIGNVSEMVWKQWISLRDEVRRLRDVTSDDDEIGQAICSKAEEAASSARQAYRALNDIQYRSLGKIDDWCGGTDG